MVVGVVGGVPVVRHLPAVYTYDVSPRSFEANSPASERGPPTLAYGYTALRSALDDHGSRGDSARPRPGSIWTQTAYDGVPRSAQLDSGRAAYDHTGQFAQGTGSPGTTRTASGGSAVSVRAVQVVRCATNTGRALTHADLTPAQLST